MSDAFSDAYSPASLAGDKLKGVEQIAAFIDEPVRRTFLLCQAGKLPVGRQGRYYVGSKTLLTQFYRKLASGQAA
jgi:hypothetical protein